MQTANTLWQLKMFTCSINDDAVSRLSVSLGRNFGLKCLYLYDNQIGDVGATALGELIGYGRFDIFDHYPPRDALVMCYHHGGFSSECTPV